MRKVTLTRQQTSDTGTFGLIETDSGFSCYCGELPWRGNKPEISCFPDGVYLAHKITSPKHGPCYVLSDVPGRTDVEIHRGNFCGDTAKGFKSDVLGCVILGNAIGEMAGQECVINSRDALSRFEADLEGEDFQLTVRWVKGIGPGL